MTSTNEQPVVGSILTVKEAKASAEKAKAALKKNEVFSEEEKAKALSENEVLAEGDEIPKSTEQSEGAVSANPTPST